MNIHTETKICCFLAEDINQGLMIVSLARFSLNEGAVLPCLEIIGEATFGNSSNKRFVESGNCVLQRSLGYCPRKLGMDVDEELQFPSSKKL